nr:hypothetical protein [Saccharothrix luteola]
MVTWTGGGCGGNRVPRAPVPTAVLRSGSTWKGPCTSGRAGPDTGSRAETAVSRRGLPHLVREPGGCLIGPFRELHHGKHHAAYVKGANDTLERLARPGRRRTSPASSAWRRPSRSTCRGTCCTRCSGTT